MNLKSKHRRIKNLLTDDEIKALVIERLKFEMNVLKNLLFKSN
jgi:hypothetical protein